MEAAFKERFPSENINNADFSEVLQELGYRGTIVFEDSNLLQFNCSSAMGPTNESGSSAIGATVETIAGNMDMQQMRDILKSMQDKKLVLNERLAQFVFTSRNASSS